jgi:hypothetical protein
MTAFGLAMSVALLNAGRRLSAGHSLTPASVWGDAVSPYSVRTTLPGSVPEFFPEKMIETALKTV